MTLQKDAETLARFAKTAPGRLPSLVQDAVNRVLGEQPTTTTRHKYIIGQRVIIPGNMIAVVIEPPGRPRDSDIWVRTPGNNELWYDCMNVKPLPGGQL